MSRPLRVGDRVTATGTVMDARDVEYAVVGWDGDEIARYSVTYAALTLIEPAEPPVGSVVVKDGMAWTRLGPEQATGVNGRSGWVSWDDSLREWSDISDGEVIFAPGGDA